MPASQRAALQQQMEALDEKASSLSIPNITRAVAALKKAGADQAVETILILLRQDRSVRDEALETVKYLRDLQKTFP